MQHQACSGIVLFRKISIMTIVNRPTHLRGHLDKGEPFAHLLLRIPTKLDLADEPVLNIRAGYA